MGGGAHDGWLIVAVAALIVFAIGAAYRLGRVERALLNHKRWLLKLREEAWPFNVRGDEDV